MEEMQEEFRGLAMMIHRHASRGWNTAYRDFANMLVLLSVLQPLGMEKNSNGNISRGEYRAVTGVYSIDWKTFVDIMDLGSTSATWGNRISTHTQIMNIDSFFRFSDRASFLTSDHREAWNVVSQWLLVGDQFLPDSHWAARKYGNTSLQKLV